MNLVLDSETLPVSATAIGLTAAKFTKTVTHVTIYCEGSIRYWSSGKAPTSSDGVPMYDGTERTFSVGEAMHFKAIRKTEEDAKIHVQYLHSS